MLNTLDKEQVAIPVTEYLFSETIRHAGLTEYGYSLSDLNRGLPIPAAGARFDIAFEGELAGPEIKGTIKGVDFLLLRADGRFQLNLQATITTDDGEKIALHEDGIMLQPDEKGIAGLRLNMQFITASPKYQWLNDHLVWGIGEANMQQGTVTVKAFIA